ncbi:hypothetical protein JCM19236_614 [Vibrio sp. JCM 19236]|nr:hypothetical protein JCM19236_614 [Vibrio sp. JCM 19236]
MASVNDETCFGFRPFKHVLLGSVIEPPNHEVEDAVND